MLHRAVRAELRGLPKDLAETVAGHLVVAGELIDSDPDLAYRHAEAARRRAARLPIVREAAAETAYAAGRYDVALNEFRALRRMTGQHGFLPVMADCERALGRAQAAITMAREADQLGLDPRDQIEMRIVEAGARSDLGQAAEGIRLLREVLTRLPAAPNRNPGAPAARGASRNQQRQREQLLSARARVHYALADLLLADGDTAAARREFTAAAELDTEGETDAELRLEEFDGVAIDFDDTDDDTGDDTHDDIDDVTDGIDSDDRNAVIRPDRDDSSSEPA